MGIRQYKVGELKKIINESLKEFKPVVGNKENEKINREAYNDIFKKTKKYDGVKNKSNDSVIPQDDNKGMQDITYDNINDTFKKNVQSQMKGYTSSEAEKNHKNDDFGNAVFTDIKKIGEKAKQFKKGKDVSKKIGLTSREINKKDFEDQTHTVFENKIKKIKFKKTEFVTESHMLSKIPDEFKKNGEKFYVVDGKNNEYLVEWNEEPKVFNLSKINEQKSRIQELFNYTRPKTETTYSSRLTEENTINDMIIKTRNLNKQNKK